jgi:predicted RNA-binding Zn ribbon-like protein
MVSLAASCHSGDAVSAPQDGLCLGFANTRCWRGRAEPTETLSDFTALMDWCRADGLVAATRARAFEREMASGPDGGGVAFRKAVDLREAIFAVFAAIAAGAKPSHQDLARLDRALGLAPVRNGIAPGGDGFLWRVAPREGMKTSDDIGDDIDVGVSALLVPVLWSAGDLLTGAKRAKVRQCANDRCLWLFIDDSKSGTRRWCAMSACGNRAKAHRHYLRHRQQGSTQIGG